MVVIGGFGGLLNYLHNFDSYSEDSKGKSAIKYILLGIGSAILVPAFLKMISSNLLSSNDNNDFLIFAGFCLIAAIFSKRFITTIGEKILEAAKKAEKVSIENKQQLKDTQFELSSTKERIEDVKLAVDIQNSAGIRIKDEHFETTLTTLANSYIEKTSIPDYDQRLRLKAELGRRMGEIIARNNISKDTLLKQNQSEGMLMALAYSVQLRPSDGDLQILSSISKHTKQLYTKYSILLAYDTLARNGFINSDQIEEILDIINKFKVGADLPLQRKIDDSLNVIKVVASLK